MLHSILYRSSGHLRRVTLASDDLFAAETLARLWERISGAEVLEVSAVGRSRFVERGGKIILRRQK